MKSPALSALNHNEIKKAPRITGGLFSCGGEAAAGPLDLARAARFDGLTFGARNIAVDLAFQNGQWDAAIL